MTRSEVASKAFSVGGNVAGPVLGIPFFLGLLLLHGNDGNDRVWLTWAMCYMVLIVFPASAYVGSAMAAFVSPVGQERAYAKSAALWYVSVLFALIILVTSTQLYAYWPFASSQQLSQALVGPSSKITAPILILLGGIIFVPGAATLGYIAGCYGRRCPRHFVAQFLKLCWKLSKKDPLSNPGAQPLHQPQ